MKCLVPILVAILGSSLSVHAAHPDHDKSAKLFDSKIAPIFARYCFECHDTANQEGKLDLSKKDSAMGNRKGGKAIVPGKSSESPLWKAVEANEMPEDRPPLSPEEKKSLKEWIDSGAVWTADTIDSIAVGRDARATASWIRRLTVPEYVETVRAAVGIDIEKDANRLLPADVRADGFHNTAYNLTADILHVEAYSRLAGIIISKMDVLAFVSRFGDCKDVNDQCMAEFVSKMGKWLVRGPLEKHETKSFLALAKAVTKDGGNFKEAASYVVEAMLQSPRFIYRIENQTGDGKPRPASTYELASRLSYTIWGAPPDEELLKTADSGKLHEDKVLRSQVSRMLEDPRAIKRSSRFLYEWLDLDRLKNLRPDPKKFPKWNESLAADMRAETLAYFEEIAWKQKRPLANLLNARITFATPRLAEFYGIKPKSRTLEKLSPASKSGLVVLYNFKEGSGDTITDATGKDPINLKIESPAAVEWKKEGLRLKDSTLISSTGSTRKLVNVMKKSNAITLEAWITPASASQNGPARIVTFSSGASTRNFTLGQEKEEYDLRLRTSSTDGNGLPSLTTSGKAAKQKLTHVVYTRAASGAAKLYVNGVEKAARQITGDLASWDEKFKVALGNETSKDRPWKGTYHLVAIYDRALTPAEISASSQPFERYDLASTPARGGLLTQGSFLTVGGEEASMVARGLTVLHDFLYSAVGNPPPCADTTPVPTKPGLTQRAIAQARIDNKSCGGCHSKFEPLAFGLEKFDGLGAFHQKDEHGNQLREDGEILFPGEAKPVPYKTATELMNLLAASPRVQKNFTRKVTQFAIGRPLVESDAPLIDKIHATAQKNGGTYASVITAIVTSDLVRMTQTEKQEIASK